MPTSSKRKHSHVMEKFGIMDMVRLGYNLSDLTLDLIFNVTDVSN